MARAEGIRICIWRDPSPLDEFRRQRPYQLPKPRPGPQMPSRDLRWLKRWDTSSRLHTKSLNSSFALIAVFESTSGVGSAVGFPYLHGLADPVSRITNRAY